MSKRSSWVQSMPLSTTDYGDALSRVALVPGRHDVDILSVALTEMPLAGVEGVNSGAIDGVCGVPARFEDLGIHTVQPSLDGVEGWEVMVVFVWICCQLQVVGSGSEVVPNEETGDADIVDVHGDFLAFGIENDRV